MNKWINLFTDITGLWTCLFIVIQILFIHPMLEPNMFIKYWECLGGLLFVGLFGVKLAEDIKEVSGYESKNRIPKK